MLHARAVQLLLLATAFWGISFPAMRALGLIQEARLPDVGSWFATGVIVTLRFGGAAVVVLLWSLPTLRHLTRRELAQGLGLGLFGGLGILLQTDGLSHTAASTSAFITQGYCLLLPLIVAWRDRRWPPRRVLLCCCGVAVGLAILVDIRWQEFRLGRGELETLLASLMFTGQILWLERPQYAGNRVRHFTGVMFLVMALSGVPIALAAGRGGSDWVTFVLAPGVIGLIAVLVVACTLVAYVLMNCWQPHVTATEAGLIYCTEPIFASLFAMVLPSWISGWTGIPYANETMTWRLALGGGLITLANLWLYFRPAVASTHPIVDVRALPSNPPAPGA